MKQFQNKEATCSSQQLRGKEADTADHSVSHGETDAAGQQNNGGTDWINNPALGNINPAKLQMLSALASQAKGKNQNELLPFLMAAAAQSQSNHMTFNNDEIDAVISVMKIGKSPQELQQIDRLCGLIRQFKQFSR